MKRLSDLHTHALRSGFWGLLCVVLGASCASGVPVQSAADVSPNWQAFERGAFERARRENKMILLSVQAGWCHWCHVMNATTYRDPAVLRELSAHFVTIAVDQDAHPDLAARYENWGWPATVLMSPSGSELRKLRGHRSPTRFLKILRDARHDHEAGRSPSRESVAQAGPADLDALRQSARAQLDGYYDEEAGGWGERQKYPLSAPVIEYLWRTARGESGAWTARVQQTLDGYAQLIDPVDGGMFQYSLHGVWDRPHFEKIAPIQAGAIEAFVAAYRVTGDRQQVSRAEDVARYLLDTLRSEDGAFYASQDADVGRLGEAGHRAGADYYSRDAEARASLAPPRLDTHVYAELNGRLISALAELAAVSDDPRWGQAARAALTQVDASLRDPDGVYRHAQRALGARYASDQVQMLRAHLAVYELTGGPAYLARAEAIAAVLRTDFVDANGALTSRDQALGAGAFAESLAPLRLNGEAAFALVRLAAASDQPDLRDVASAMLRVSAASQPLRAQGRKVGPFLLALEALRAPGLKLLVVAEADDPRAEPLTRARVFAPAAAHLRATPDATDYPYPGQPVLYACSDSACSSPILRPDDVQSAIAPFLVPD